MVLLTLGISHNSAPVEIREQLALDQAGSIKVLNALKQCKGVVEAVVVSTCNRTELYLLVTNSIPVLRWLNENQKFELSTLARYSYLLRGQQVVEHLMRVVCGIDSMILGEAEILGQVKSAFAMALDSGAVGKALGRMFQMAFSLAKLVRTKTEIGVNPISVAYSATRLPAKFFSDLGKVAVLLIGAGETITLVAKYLNDLGIKKIFIANRTLQNAEKLARKFSYQAIKLDDISYHLPKVDIVFASTASSIALLGKGMVESAMQARKNKTMLLVDLAVPRDIEPEVRSLENVYLYCIDDLEVIVSENKKIRQHAAKEAELIIAARKDDFLAWLKEQDAVDTLKAMREHFAAVSCDLLVSARRQLKSGRNPEAVLEWFANSLTNKLLHEPMVQLRQAGATGKHELFALTETLFNLNI